jgi:hypothetical protein
MGWQTKRRARRLPKLIEGLQAGRSRLADHASQREGDDQVRKADQFIEQAREYQSEFEQTGAVSDPRFDGWFKTARMFAYFAKRSS